MKPVPPPGVLPIDAVLGDVRAALRDAGAAVLVAPPGAGKTTAVAPALLAEPWCTGTVMLLSPRRVAARAAADRMAEMLGEPVGGTVGYVTRLDSRRSARTRILVVTEAIFTAAILDDPELAGVSAVLFDEAHERHLAADLGLALAIEARGVLRADLRLLVMSATLDGARFAALLGDAPVIESAGRSHPLAIRWLGARPELRTEDALADAVVTAWREQEGDILGFLPGVREVARSAERLAERIPDALILPLHGQCEPAAQRAAIRRDAGGRRRIVLATAIAETSLTLDGVAVVVDAGLSRRAEFDRAAGVTRLVTRAASQAAATQRAGRAARQGPGVAYRLWAEAAHAGRPCFDPPEMLTSDLAPLRLTLARWGTADPAGLAWLDPPPAPALAAAEATLAALGALDGDGRITAHGQAMAALPLEPALAHMLLFARARGAEARAARLALLLQERGLGGRGEDLAQRLEHWDADRSTRAQASRRLASGWARKVAGTAGAPVPAPARNPARAATIKLAPTPTPAHPEPVEALLPSGDLARGSTGKAGPTNAGQAGEGDGPWLQAGSDASGGSVPLGVLLAEAYPENLARRRGGTAGEDWLSAGGRGLRLDGASALARAEWLAVGEAQGQAGGARITAAAALTTADVERWLGHRIARRAALRWLPDERRVEALVERRIGAIVLSRGPDPAPDQAAIAALLVDKVREGGLALLPLPPAADALLRRGRFAGIAALDAPALLAAADEWLAPLLERRLDDVAPAALHDALCARMSWDESRRLERLAPPAFTSPAGTRHAIAYDDAGGPSVEVRVQALFGLDRHPTFGDPPQPLLLRLTSPAGRPIQTTRDLPGFWRGTWADVAREMKGRYPRHRWPAEPWREEPSLRTRNAFDAQRGA